MLLRFMQITHFYFQFLQVQSLEIAIEDEDFVGMPFVLLSGEKWIKNNGSDFYVDFRTQPQRVKENYLSPYNYIVNLM